jgi:hypothetical protein
LHQQSAAQNPGPGAEIAGVHEEVAIEEVNDEEKSDRHSDEPEVRYSREFNYDTEYPTRTQRLPDAGFMNRGELSTESRFVVHSSGSGENQRLRHLRTLDE